VLVHRDGIYRESDGNGLALDHTNFSPTEVKLIEPLLEHRVLPRVSNRLFYDSADDSDPLGTHIWRKG
jgi:hypothetical protein